MKVQTKRKHNYWQINNNMFDIVMKPKYLKSNNCQNLGVPLNIKLIVKIDGLIWHELKPWIFIYQHECISRTIIITIPQPNFHHNGHLTFCSSKDYASFVGYIHEKEIAHFGRFWYNFGLNWEPRTSPTTKTL
jgi:hypothetical protein